MTIEEIIRLLEEERRIGSRYPARIIFVQNLQQYGRLIEQLSLYCRTTLNLGNYCSADDVFPDFARLKSDLASFGEQHILLLAVDEYMRLRIKSEINRETAHLPEFLTSQQGSQSRARIIIPLYAAKELFERIITELDSRQERHIWEIETTSQEADGISLDMYSPPFREVIGPAIHGIKNWLIGNKAPFSAHKQAKLVTQRYSSAEAIEDSAFSIRVISDPFRYINSKLSTDHLQQEWGTDEYWTQLIAYIGQNSSAQEAILSALNTHVFDGIRMLSCWRVLTPFQRWLVWLWYQINPGADYLCYAISRAKKVIEIENAIMTSIFSCYHERPEWLDQCRLSMEALNLSYMTPEHFKQLDAIDDIAKRISLLNCQTHLERTYAIRTICRLIEDGINLENAAQLVGNQYPLLQAYLSSTITNSAELNQYFSWYRVRKLTGEAGIPSVPFVNLDAFDSRLSFLQKYDTSASYMLWIDAMGIEWLPLLLFCLKPLEPDVHIQSQVGTAIAPTETEFNEQWFELKCNHEKWDRLDKLAHSGTPDDRDYFSCIAKQLEIIQDIASYAISLVDQYDTVIITADHGCSRLAARAFHTFPAVELPKGAISKSFGRYCICPALPSIGEVHPSAQAVSRDGINYLVMKTHEHFKQSGNAAGSEPDIMGEVHGGLTPEEYLVPIIILEKSSTLHSLTYTVETPIVYRSNDRITLRLRFSRNISSVVAVVEGLAGICEKKDSSVWEISFSGLELGEHQLEVNADNNFLPYKETFRINSRGIQRNDDLFGGI